MAVPETAVCGATFRGGPLVLSLLIFLPLAGGVLAALLPPGRGGRTAGTVSLVFAAATLGLSIGLLIDFDYGGSQNVTAFGDGAPEALLQFIYGQQHVTDTVWISELGIHYKLALDGLNLFLI